MLRRKKKPPPQYGDNPLFRRHYEETYGIGFLKDPEENRQSYLTWLQDRGIDPVSGKMTEAGLTLYKTLLEKEEAKH